MDNDVKPSFHDESDGSAYGESPTKTAKKSPTKRGRPAKSSPSKKTVSKTTKDSITIGPGEEVKASHPAVVMELVEIALDRVTPEDRARVATKYGLKPNLLHMNWANIQKRKIARVVKDAIS